MTDNDQPSARDTGRPTASGYLLVGGGLFLSVVVLVVLFLSQAQFAGQPQKPDAKPTVDDRNRQAAFKFDGADIGRSFSSYAEFIEHQERNGFIFLGRFEDEWPATITDERTARNEIEFQRSNGTKHRYPGYDGYRLKVVRLKTQRGTEAVVVLRSRDRE